MVSKAPSRVMRALIAPWVRTLSGNGTCGTPKRAFSVSFGLDRRTVFPVHSLPSRYRMHVIACPSRGQCIRKRTILNFIFRCAKLSSYTATGKSWTNLDVHCPPQVAEVRFGPRFQKTKLVGAEIHFLANQVLRLLQQIETIQHFSPPRRHRTKRLSRNFNSLGIYRDPFRI